MSDPTKDFLGSGWKFPPRLDSRGRIELVHQEQDIEEAIYMILRTNPGERPQRPEFGTHLNRIQFAPNDATTAGLACRYVEEALKRWEPRIEVAKVQARSDDNNPSRLMLDIRYRVRVTNSERNLVFPFYMIPGED